MRKILLLALIATLSLPAAELLAKGTSKSGSSRSTSRGTSSSSRKTSNFSDSSSTKGYMKKNGTYVHSYNRSKPDKSQHNNYSTKGRTNPYTGKTGTRSTSK